MKTFIKMLISSALVSVFSHALSAVPPVKAVYVILSPYYEPQDRASASGAVTDIILHAPLGSRLVFIDGWDLQTIAEVTLPEHLLQDSVPSRRKAARLAIARLLSWFQRTGSAPRHPTLSGTAAMDVPRALELTSADPAGGPRAILVVGSPIYQSPQEPQFSFVPDRFMADGGLFADKSISVFSVLGKRNRLTNSQVFFWYPGERVFGSDLYRDRVERFWSLFVAYQRGSMVAFNADGPGTLSNLFRPELPAVRRDNPDPRFNKVEMLSIARDIPYRRITNSTGDATFVVEASPAARAEAAVISDLETIPDSKTALGIMWSIQGLDLDLYVWHHPNAQPLFYRNTTTPEGRYIHDYTDRNEGLDYEKVILETATDLRQLKAFVNFYAGQTVEPVKGKVFLRHAGRTYAGVFALTSRNGNRGVDVDARTSSPFWTELKLTELQSRPSDSVAVR
jgi:hypothetical protein